MERLNFRNEIYSVFDICRKISKGAIINTNTSNINKVEIVDLVLSGYPLPKIFAQETIEGNLIIDSEIIFVLNELKKEYDLSNEEIAYLESIEIDFFVAKPSLKNSIDTKRLKFLLSL